MRGVCKQYQQVLDEPSISTLHCRLFEGRRRGQDPPSWVPRRPDTHYGAPMKRTPTRCVAQRPNPRPTAGRKAPLRSRPRSRAAPLPRGEGWETVATAPTMGRRQATPPNCPSLPRSASPRTRKGPPHYTAARCPERSSPLSGVETELGHDASILDQRPVAGTTSLRSKKPCSMHARRLALALHGDSCAGRRTIRPHDLPAIREEAKNVDRVAQLRSSTLRECNVIFVLYDPDVPT